MKTAALFLSTLALATAAIEWDDLVVTWRVASQDPSRDNSFFGIPRTLDDAEEQGWVEVTGVNIESVTTHCLQDDPRFCVLYDSYGFPAGVQIGILVSDLANVQNIYNMARINNYQLKTIFDQEVWTVVCFTQDPEILATGGRSSTWDGLTGTDGVWLQTTSGYGKIPRNLEDLDTVWVKEACIPAMGTHYYYDMHSDGNVTVCENYQPWFLLYRNGTLTGLGVQAFGKSTIKSRSWYDVIPEGGVERVVIDGPQCLYDWAASYGIVSMHVYFTAEPWNITC